MVIHLIYLHHVWNKQFKIHASHKNENVDVVFCLKSNVPYKMRCIYAQSTFCLSFWNEKGLQSGSEM